MTFLVRQNEFLVRQKDRALFNTPIKNMGFFQPQIYKLLDNLFKKNTPAVN
jgi:hypothetical protein